MPSMEPAGNQRDDLAITQLEEAVMWAPQWSLLVVSETIIEMAGFTTIMAAPQ